ncbi:MAG: universal stress protein [Bacteroidia bacterium]
MASSSKTKNILVGIDYSKSSTNALHYALMLADRSKSKVTMFHVFEFPLVHTNSGLYLLNYRDVKKYDLEKMDKIKITAMKDFPNVKIELVNTTENIGSYIESEAKKKKIDYVVMGLETKSKIAEFIQGTTGVKLSTKINCPVIIVPEKYKTHDLVHAVVTVDNKENIKKRSMDKVDAFAKQHKCNRQILHIKTEDEFLMIYERKSKTDNKKWGVKSVESKDFLSGLKNYVKNNKVDLAIVFSHSHSMIYNMFNESNTKAIAFGLNVPVMAIHE